MLKKITFLLSITMLSLLLYPPLCYCSNSEINGIIIDINSKEPLPSASIILFEKSTNKLFKVEVSDLEGKFHFTNIPSNNYLLKIQYVGYQEKIIDSLNLSEKIDLGIIYISAIEQKLSEVNILGTKSIIEQNATSTTVNVAESSLATGGSIFEMLQKIPGVTAKEDAISARGKPLSLLLDGRLVNLPPEEVINLLKSLPNSSIEKMELINNPKGKYDGQVQAILNIKTFKPKNDFLGGNVTISGGMGRKMRSNASMNLFYKKNKFSSSIGWNYLNNSKIGFINRFFDLGSSDIVHLFDEKRKLILLQYTSTFKLDLEYQLHRYHTIGISLRSTLNPQNGITQATTNILRKDSSKIDSIYNYTSATQLTLNTTIGNIYYKTTFDNAKNKELFINGDYCKYDRLFQGDYIIKTLQSDFTEKNNPSIYLNKNPTYIAIRSATADYIHTTSFGNWQAGLKTSWTDVKNNSSWDKKEDDIWITNSLLTDQFLYNEYIQAAYIGFSKEVKKINIDASIRAEHTFSKGESLTLKETYIKNYTNLFPTVEIKYQPSQNHEWIISYRRGIRRPLYQEINPFIRMRTPNLYIEGNPNLVPELSHFEEITYAYRQKLFAKILLRQHIPCLWFMMEEIPFNKNGIQNGLVEKVVNYTSFYEGLATLYFNHSLASWWNTTISIETYFESGKYLNVPSGDVTPRFSFSFSSSISLPNNWNIESAGVSYTGFKNGYSYYGPSYEISFGLKKSFLEKKLTTSLMLNGYFPYWYKDGYLNVYSDGRISNDLRYFMVSINYKLGKNTGLTNRKSGVETEKNRLKE